MAAMRMLLHAGSDPSVGRRFARSTVVPSSETPGPSPRWRYGLCGTAGGTRGKWVLTRFPPTVLQTFAGSPSKIRA